MKVKLLDETCKTVLIDETLSVNEIVQNLVKKMGTQNWEEYSLQIMKESGDGNENKHT